jgi:hypothetical protein
MDQGTATVLVAFIVAVVGPMALAWQTRRQVKAIVPKLDVLAEKSDEIHGLVNSTLTSAIAGERDALVKLLAALIAPTRGTGEDIAAAKAAIVESDARLTERESK